MPEYRKLAKGASPFGGHVPELLLSIRVLFGGARLAAGFRQSVRLGGRPTKEDSAELCRCRPTRPSQRPVGSHGKRQEAAQYSRKASNSEPPGPWFPHEMPPESRNSPFPPEKRPFARSAFQICGRLA